MNFNIKIDDPAYPKLLKQIKDPPKSLYYKGNFSNKIFENCLGVVGSRKVTSYGQYVVNKLVTELAHAGITIVSGFMYGVDAHAHQAAIKSGGKTIAVMPCGIELIHPSILKDLYNRILNANNLILSEYKDTFKPCLWTYPRRNRIIAGLCKAVLVIEAQEKSGSLITARFARKFNRKVFCVPSPINSLNSKGIINLIKEGAAVVGDAADILDFYQLNFRAAKKDSNTRLERLILDNLKYEPSDYDTLSQKTGLKDGKLGSGLISLILEEKIIEQGGMYYAN